MLPFLRLFDTQLATQSGTSPRMASVHVATVMGSPFRQAYCVNFMGSVILAFFFSLFIGSNTPWSWLSSV